MRPPRRVGLFVPVACVLLALGPRQVLGGCDRHGMCVKMVASNALAKRNCLDSIGCSMDYTGDSWGQETSHKVNCWLDQEFFNSFECESGDCFEVMRRLGLSAGVKHGEGHAPSLPLTFSHRIQIVAHAQVDGVLRVAGLYHLPGSIVEVARQALYTHHTLRLATATAREGKRRVRNRNHVE